MTAFIRPFKLIAMVTIVLGSTFPLNAALGSDIITSSDTGVAFVESDCQLQGYEVSEPWFIQDQFDYLKGFVTITMDCAGRDGHRFTRKRTAAAWFLEPQFDAYRRVWTLNGRDLAQAFHALDVVLADDIATSVWSDPTGGAIVVRIDLVDSTGRP